MSSSVNIDAATLHRRAASEFGARVHGVADDHWVLATPCAGWNVRALVAHLVDEQLWTAPLLEGRTVEAVAPDIPSDPLGDDPIGAWDLSARDAVEAVAHTDLAAIVHLSFGDFPAEFYVMQLFADLLVHSWDLARATGQDERVDPELVDALAGWFDGQEDAYRSAQVIADRVPVPESAGAQAKLLARFGRRP